MGKLNLYKNKILQKKSDALSYGKDFDKIQKILDINTSTIYPNYGGTDKNNIVQKIKSKVIDIARTNIFSFQLTKEPNKLIGSPLLEELNESMEFLIETVNIPNKKITPIMVKYNGVQRRFPNYYDLDPIKIKFYLDKSYNIYRFFNVWITEITGRSSSGKDTGVVGLSYLDDIIAIGRIKVLDVKKEEIYYCELTELYPIEISGLSYDTKTEGVQTFEVTFSYRDAISEETKDYHSPEIALKQQYMKGLDPSISRITVDGIVDRIDSLRNVINKYK